MREGELIRLARFSGAPVLLLGLDGEVLDAAGAGGLALPERVGQPADLRRMASVGTPVPATWEIDGRTWRAHGSRNRSASKTLVVRLELVSSEGFESLNRWLSRLRQSEHDLTLALRQAQRAEARALDLAERYRSVVMNTPTPMARLDRSLTVREVNRALANLVGSPMLTVTGRTITELGSTAADALGIVARITQECFDHERLAEAAGVHFEIDGEDRWVDFMAVPERSASAGRTATVLVIGSDVTERVRAEQELATMARTDTLTGLQNRPVFETHLEHALKMLDRVDSGVAVLFIDLDRFKQVNDGRGHQAGDDVLRRTAARLMSAARETDVVARLGGDEFGVIAQNVANVDDAAMLAERFAVAIGAQTSREEQPVTASVGVVHVTERAPLLTVLRRADTAMYRAKVRGGDGVAVFEPTMYVEARHQAALHAELRAAIGTGALVLHYQPIVMLDDGAVVGGEALIRWRHPGRGLIGPAEFLPLATELGLMGAIGTHVMSEALGQLTEWERAGVLPDDFVLHVNVAPAQLSDEHHLADLIQLIAAARLRPGRLRIEVTEQDLLADHRAPSSSIRHLAELGVGVALDDFGTGSSSLTHLRTYPIDAIKIDRAFVGRVVDDQSDRAIIRAVSGLGVGLGLEVVAEGVENDDQLRVLQELGCRRGQGFLWSRAVPAPEFTDWLTECVAERSPA